MEEEKVLTAPANTQHPGSENLQPFSARTEEQQREIRSKGGKASQKKQKEKKTFKNSLEILLALPARPEDVKKLQAKFPGLKAKGLTLRDLMGLQQIARSISKQSAKSFEVVRDTVGEKPIDKMNFDITPPTIIEDIPAPDTEYLESTAETKSENE